MSQPGMCSTGIVGRAGSGEPAAEGKAAAWRRLHAFGDHLAPKGARRLHHGADDRARPAVLQHVEHEAAVDLRRSKGSWRKWRRGVAGAEVVERDAYAEAMAGPSTSIASTMSSSAGGFEDLELQALGRDVGMLQRAAHAGDEARLHQRTGTDTDADADVQSGRAAAPRALSAWSTTHRRAGLQPVPEVGQEVARRQQAAFGMLPAQQGFMPSGRRRPCPPEAGERSTNSCRRKAWSGA